MKITHYKYSCVSWRVDKKGFIIKASHKTDEELFETENPLQTRREVTTYLADQFIKIVSIEKALKDDKELRVPTLVYHLRHFYVVDGEEEFCINSASNLQESFRYPIVSILRNLDREAELYLENGYETGGEVQVVTYPDSTTKYRVLSDTAGPLKEALANM
jgi:hypothetical protein